MTEREKLLELICTVNCEGGEDFLSCPERRNGHCRSIHKLEMCQLGAIADHLLANGVIVPPCKVGDKVYKIMTSFGYVRECKVVGFHLGKFPTLRGIKRKEYFVCYADHYLYHIPFDDIGKTVFLSREDADKALKGVE